MSAQEAKARVDALSDAEAVRLVEKLVPEWVAYALTKNNKSQVIQGPFTANGLFYL